MLVSKQFLRDFAYCANRYGWNDADIAEIKQAVREGTGYREFIVRLAAAHRAGYDPSINNNFMRLTEWENILK